MGFDSPWWRLLSSSSCNIFLPVVLLSSFLGWFCSLEDVEGEDDSESNVQPGNAIPGVDEVVPGGVRDTGHLPLPLSGCTG